MNHRPSIRALRSLRRRLLIVLALTVSTMTVIDIAERGVATAAQNGTPTNPPGAQRGQLLEGRYVITFSGATNGRGRQDLIDSLVLAGATIERNLEKSLNAVVITFGGAPTQAQSGALNQLKRSGARVEQDQVVSNGSGAVPVPAATQTSAPWGLDRIDQTTGLNGTYIDAGTGSGVTVYVIDTGISTHDDFASRLSPGVNMIADRSESDATDGNGHGTHVAGTIAGTVHGVAKSAQLVPVRVLDDGGSGAISGVIAGIEWVLGNHTPGTPGIINMSLGGGISESLDDAVEAAVDAGMVVAVAAGNYGEDACEYSPARATSAITVGATTSTDSRASYSNYGTCLDIFAPGSSIRSTWNDGGTNIISGTSMATPHVAGAAAVLWGNDPTLDAATIASTVIAAATSDLVTTPGDGSPNRLLYMAPPATEPDSGGTSPSPSPSRSAPGAPTGVSAQADDVSVTVTWSAPSDNGGATITRYTVTGTESGRTCTWLTGPLICTLGPLGNGEHTFTVTATNSVGTSPASAPSAPVTVSPSNDWFAGARSTTGASGRVTDSNDDASIEVGEPAQSYGSGGATIWYRYTVATSGTLTIDTVGSTFDTVLEIFDGTTLSNLTLRAANDDVDPADDSEDTTSRLIEEVSRGDVLFIRVSSFDGSVGDISLGWSLDEIVVTLSAIGPTRLFDTRSGLGDVPQGRVTSESTLEVDVLGVAGIPQTGVAAISLNVTATGTETGDFGGYVTVHSCDGATPNASNLNFDTGRTIANAVIVPVSAAGTICFDVFGSTHLIADVNGAFLADSGFRPISPTRRADTRSNIGGVGTDRIGGDTPLRLQMTGTAGVPATGVRSVSLNLTVTDTTAPDVGGYVTVYPCDVAKPDVSNLNFNTGDTVANAVTTPVSDTGEICVSVFGSAHVIIDVNGAITDDATFGAVSPVRVADSRRGSGPVGEINGAGGPLRVQISGVGGVPETGVAAVTLNLTVTGTTANAFGGYATVYPCDRSKPDASTVNFVGGDTVANAAIAPVSLSGEICVHVYGRASVIVDVNGWLAG